MLAQSNTSTAKSGAKIKKRGPNPLVDLHVSDKQWAVLEPVLFSATGQRRKAHRTFLNAALSVLKGGHSWRDLDPVYGSWNTNYVKFRRWATAGIWDQLLPVLVSLKMTKNWQISFEDSKGFPTTTWIIVNQARAFKGREKPSKSIVEQLT